jgi:hypothetical protein
MKTVEFRTFNIVIIDVVQKSEFHVFQFWLGMIQSNLGSSTSTQSNLLVI